MELRLEIPEKIAQSFGNTSKAAARQILESAAAEGFRSGRLSHNEVREMLGLSWHETEEFLARHDCSLQYTTADLEEDRRNFSDLPKR
jgi:predicted HTH domain antitoxin